MGLMDILEAAEAVGDRDETRRRVFEEELDVYEAGELDRFERTREALTAQQDALDRLERELDAEAGSIDDLEEYAGFLSVDQAVRHREETLEKLAAHNQALRAFHDAMTEATDIVETNLEALEQDGPSAVDADPEPAFVRARDALEDHNKAVEGLGTNLSILNAYLA